MEITPLNVFAPHLPQAGFGGWRWHAKSYATSTRDALKIWDTAPMGRKVQYWLQRGIKWESFSSGVCGSRSVTFCVAGLRANCRELHVQQGVGWLNEGCLQRPSTRASCAAGEVGGDGRASILSPDRGRVALAPAWSSRQNVPVLSPEYP